MYGEGKRCEMERSVTKKLVSKRIMIYEGADHAFFNDTGPNLGAVMAFLDKHLKAD
jgi:dienelactone hydrolase